MRIPSTLHRRFACIGLVAALVAVASSTIAAAATKPTSTKPETSSLTMPLTASSAAVGYQQFAAEKGYYDKYGLSVTAPATDNNTVRAALVAGSSPLVGLATIDILTLIGSGLKLKILGCQHLGVPFQMWAKNDVKTAKDLKGKTIGVSGAVSSVAVATFQFLDANGVSRDDVTIVPLGSVPNIMAALSAGRIDAGLLSYPLNQTASNTDGLHKLGDAPVNTNVYVVSSDWAKENRNTVMAWLRGNTEGLVAYGTDRAAALPVLAKLLRLNLDDPAQSATVKEGYQLYHASYSPIGQCTNSDFEPFVPYVTPEQQATLANPSKYLDNSYVKALVAEGFYAKLTKKYGAFPGITP